MKLSLSRCAMLVVLTVLLGACAAIPRQAATSIPRTVRFEFIHRAHKETFHAETNDPAVIAKVRAELAKPFSQRNLHITGRIAAGADGVNAPWHWHYVNGEWSLAEVSMEVCDGWPGYIETHLDEWLASAGSFCPWDSRVVREL